MIPRPALANLRDDAGQISLVRSVVITLLVALVLFEVGAVAINQYQARDAASQAAADANIAFAASNRNPGAAERRAKAFLAGSGTTFIGLSIDSDNLRLSVTVEKTAKTLMIHRIERLQRYRVVRVSESVPLR